MSEWVRHAFLLITSTQQLLSKFSVIIFFPFFFSIIFSFFCIWSMKGCQGCGHYMPLGEQSVERCWQPSQSRPNQVSTYINTPTSQPTHKYMLTHSRTRTHARTPTRDLISAHSCTLAHTCVCAFVSTLLCLRSMTSDFECRKREILTITSSRTIRWSVLTNFHITFLQLIVINSQYHTRQIFPRGNSCHSVFLWRLPNR